MDLSNKLIIKARFGSEIRKVPVNNHDISFEDLIMMLQRLFSPHISSKDEITMKYADEDNDLITIQDSSELAFAIQCSRVLKLTVFVNNEPRPLDDAETAYIREELKIVRDRSIAMLDFLDRHAAGMDTESESENQSRSGRPAGSERSPVTKYASSKQSGGLINGTAASETHRSAYPPVPGGGGSTQREGREFDPLHSISSSFEPTVNNDDLRSRSDSRASNASRTGGEESLNQSQNLNTGAYGGYGASPKQQVHSSYAPPQEPPAPTIQPSIQQEVHPHHQPPMAPPVSMYGGQPQQQSGFGPPPVTVHPPPPVSSMPQQQQQQAHYPPTSTNMQQQAYSQPTTGGMFYGQQQQQQQQQHPSVPQQQQQYTHPSQQQQQQQQQQPPMPPYSQQQQMPSHQHQQGYPPTSGAPSGMYASQQAYQQQQQIPPPPTNAAMAPPPVSAPVGPPPLGPPPSGGANPYAASGGGNPFARGGGSPYMRPSYNT